MPRTKERLSTRPKATSETRQQNTPMMQSKAVQCRTNAHRTSLSVREIITRNLGSKDCAQFAGRWQDQLDHCPASAPERWLEPWRKRYFLYLDFPRSLFFLPSRVFLIINPHKLTIGYAVRRGRAALPCGWARQMPCHALPFVTSTSTESW